MTDQPDDHAYARIANRPLSPVETTALQARLDEGTVPTRRVRPRCGTKADCRNCGQPIIFKPYFLDGKQPDPPVWAHDNGAKTCSTRVPGPRGERRLVVEPAPD